MGNSKRENDQMGDEATSVTKSRANLKGLLKCKDKMNEFQSINSKNSSLDE
jgi:glutaredoxin-related protein